MMNMKYTPTVFFLAITILHELLHYKMHFFGNKGDVNKYSPKKILNNEAGD